jgi:hypothetical protein
VPTGATTSAALTRRLEGERSRRFGPSTDVARIAAGLRDRDLTIRPLQHAVEAREGFLPRVANDPECSCLDDDPHFTAIKQAIGITPGAAN